MLTATDESQGQLQPAQSAVPTWARRSPGPGRAQLGAAPRTQGDTADLGLPAVALGLQTLPARELSREAEKLLMNGATGIETPSLTSYSLI